MVSLPVEIEKYGWPEGRWEKIRNRDLKEVIGPHEPRGGSVKVSPFPKC